MFFGLSPLELVVLAGLAVVLFGPDRLPAAAAQAARLLTAARALRETALGEVREQLGPQIADLVSTRPTPAGLLRTALAEPTAQLRDLGGEISAVFATAPEPGAPGLPGDGAPDALHDAT